MLESFLNSPIFSFFNIIFIDLVMSGDNAIIIGMAAAGLPPELRRKAIIYGIMGATVLRIMFAVVALQLLAIIGLLLAGGLLLTWVCWQMWKELREGGKSEEDIEKAVREGGSGDQSKEPTGFGRALTNIIVADLSMSLDNVLAVAGAARGHLIMLIFGLVLSIALMALASTYIAKLLARHHWIAYIGLAVIAYVAGDMLWRGGIELHESLGPVYFG